MNTWKTRKTQLNWIDPSAKSSGGNITLNLEPCWPISSLKKLLPAGYLQLEVWPLNYDSYHGEGMARFSHGTIHEVVKKGDVSGRVCVNCAAVTCVVRSDDSVPQQRPGE